VRLLTIAVLVAVAAAPLAADPPAPRDILFADVWLASSAVEEVGAVYAGPTRDSRAYGDLVAVPRTCFGGRACVGVDYRAPAGDRVAWLYDVGNRGSATSVFVLARKGSWIQLPRDPFPAPVWIELGSSALDGEVAPIVGRVFGFAGGIRASNIATGRVVTISDDRRFILERISGSEVVFRAEVSDGERYRVALPRLFDRAGRPLIWPATGGR